MTSPTNRSDEIANAVTHGIGVLASIVGGAVLIWLAATRGNKRDIVVTSVFVLCLVLLYSASTSFHATKDPQLKRRLRVLDHSAIYLMIAGSYTPFMVGAIGGRWGWSLFGVAWGLAALGIVFKVYYIDHFPRMSTVVYILMGWMSVVAIGPMMRHLPPSALGLLLAGGIAYTAGTVFYHSRFRYAHAVWHLFVLAGSTLHAISVGLII